MGKLSVLIKLSSNADQYIHYLNQEPNLYLANFTHREFHCLGKFNRKEILQTLILHSCNRIDNAENISNWKICTFRFIMEVVRNKKKPTSSRSSRTDQDIEILAKEEGELIHLQVEEEETTKQFIEERDKNIKDVKMYRTENEIKTNHLQNKTILNPDDNLLNLQPYQPTDQWTRRENFHQRLKRHETSILVQHRHQEIQVCRSKEDYEYKSKRQEEDEKLIQRIEEEERLLRLRENEENKFRRREDEEIQEINELMDEINQSNENEDGSLVMHGNELELLIRLRSEEDMKMLLHQESQHLDHNFGINR